MGDGIVGVVGGVGKYPPGSLWIVNGGNNGPYRIVSKQDCEYLGGAVKWRDAVLLGGRCISPALADMVAFWIKEPGLVGAYLVSGLHVFVLGGVVREGAVDCYSVASEREFGCFYRVERMSRRSLWRCSCQECNFSGCHGLVFKVSGIEQLVCKHILGVWFTRLYLGHEGGLHHGMATD